jgi:hypothetical protein
MSFIVTRPFRLKSPSTSSSFSTLRSLRMFFAVSMEVPGGAVASGGFVMMSDRRRDSSFWKRRSRLVTMPTSLRPCVMGMPPMFCSRISRRAVPTGLVGREADGVGDDAGLEPLDAGYFAGLVRRIQVPVDDADPSLLGQGDRQLGFRDRVHRGGHDRDVELDVAAEGGRGVDFGGDDAGEARDQKDVVERDPFA